MPTINSFEEVRSYRIDSSRWIEGASLRDQWDHAGDGYERMTLAERLGWRAIPSWGRNGWDLLEWPYYILYTRDCDEGFELATNCEGDADVWRFPTAELRQEAIDQLALWHWQAKGRDWAIGATPDNMPDMLRGPFSWERLDREKKEQADA